MSGDLDPRAEKFLISLFPEKRLSQYALSQELEVSPKTPGRWYKKFFSQDSSLSNLVKKEEEGEKQNYTIYYSLTDAGREVAEEVVERRRDELEERVHELTRDLKDHRKDDNA